jgi:hypothetical protein
MDSYYCTGSKKLIGFLRSPMPAKINVQSSNCKIEKLKD